MSVPLFILGLCARQAGAPTGVRTLEQLRRVRCARWWRQHQREREAVERAGLLDGGAAERIAMATMAKTGR